MESLIDDLETLIRLESPETQLNVAAIDSASFVNELAERFEAQLMLKSLRLNKKIGIGSFRGDAFLLSRAISNLLSNAIRYGDEGGHVDLAIQREEGELRILVHNMGKPIPPSEIPKVFERLYRGEFARTSPGSGLGLTIVDRIAKLHGGNVTLESTAEAGTTFALCLPESTI
jgi:signal transduction histidine kinase